MVSVTIYTDGACRGNPGPGGWGALLIYGKHEKEICGGEAMTTNNRMELLAAIKALQAVKWSCRIVLHTDSAYVRGGICEWLPKWKANNWRSAARQPVKNQDLWRALEREAQRHDIVWRWVKGHSGNPGNERADALANRGVDKVTRRKKR